MSARILVVDDNPLNVKLLAAKLALDYYVVNTAADGQQALNKIAAEKPDIVLLDAMMPELDGFETCKRIKSDPTTAHIPVVMITALNDIADRVKGLEAGADDFLTKPINDTALMARVRSLLRLKMIMDEWRMREATSTQFGAALPPAIEAVRIEGAHIVLLENSAKDRELIVNTLGRISARVTFAGTVAEAAQMARTADCDLVFASLDIENEDGLHICPQLRTQEATRQLPILLIASENDIPRVAKGLDLGANDYLLRPIDANELLARTRTQLRQRRHYQRMQNNLEQSLALALVDPLTGAFNRRYLEAHAVRLFAGGNAAQKPVSVLMIDIDHFKKVNDVHGHAAGDIVLKETVARIGNGLRPSDLIARLGGEEFAVVMPQTGTETAFAIAERLRERIEATPIEGASPLGSLKITASIGVAIALPNVDEDMDTIFKRADAALYEAKNTGRNKVVGAKPAS